MSDELAPYGRCGMFGPMLIGKQLLAPRMQRAQVIGLGVDQRKHHRVQDVAYSGQHPGVEPIAIDLLPKPLVNARAVRLNYHHRRPTHNAAP